MTRVLFLSLAVGVIAVPAYAQAPAGSCKTVFDSMLKETITPHHTVTTMEGEPPMELIATADATYVKDKGQWIKSPRTPKDTLAQQQENIRNTTVESCSALPDEVVNGKPAAVYHAHFEQKDVGASDAKLWIAKATGLPLRSDVTLQAGQKASVVTTYDYDHITAPPVK
jgi:hypothetical protein